MPNVQVSMYLTDKEYGRYIKEKEHINAMARSAFKRRLALVKDGK